MNYAVTQRLRLIDFLLQHYGTLNRAAIEDFFGISTQQASLDVKLYLELAPANAAYDRSARVYRRGDGFRPLFGPGACPCGLR